ncbi:MAG: hypothetical protein HRT44_08315 [Bdellovibrionales bacterium]|nr:hypothetical protein [Bdellovibrionales bacterium]NQZ19243.1 hypothetical protein [Bdellovibrionales bacterium]
MDDISDFTKDIIEAIKIAEKEGSKAPVVFNANDSDKTTIDKTLAHLKQWGYTTTIDTNKNIIIQPKKNQSTE